MSGNTIVMGEYDENKERVALKKLLLQFDEINLDEYDYDPRVLGDSVPEFADSHLYAIGDLFKTFRKCELYFLPDAELKRFREFTGQALELFKRSKARPISPEEHQSIIDSSEKLYDVCFPPVSSAIAYWTAKNLDVKGQKEETESLIEQLNKRKGEAEQILRDVKETVQKATVAKEAVHFKEEAQSHKVAGYGWLSATVALALITFVFAWNSYKLYEQLILRAFAENASPFTTAQSIQLGVAKLFLFSLLVGGIVWCGRVYRAHRHNYVVNKHRQNALGTFDTFVNSAHDQQTKSAILLQATQAIFTPQHTGYISQEGEAGGYPQIMEIVRSVAEGKDKS